MSSVDIKYRAIEKLTIHTILREDLHLLKIAWKWVPHALTEVEKQTRYAICHLLFFKSTLFIHPRVLNTIQFHLYISMFLHDLSILEKENSCHDLIPNPRIFY